jgi:hypothetical protein
MIEAELIGMVDLGAAHHDQQLMAAAFGVRAGHVLSRLLPFRLVSLLEMLTPFSVLGIYVDASFVRGLQSDIMKEIKQPSDSDNPALPKHIEQLHKITESINEVANEFGLQRASERLERIASVESPSLSLLLFHLRELDLAILRDLGERKFFYMPADRVEFFYQDELFGPLVEANFKSTSFDVCEAGNCYATGRYTGCVFHCMRVVEKGLHALVRDLNNQFGTAIVFNKDIEYINWGNIIDKIESEIGKLLNPNHKPPLAPSDLAFYSQAAKEFVYFKVAWRDNVSHSRSSYDDPDEVKAIMNHVHAFMNQLATRLTE